MSARRFRITSGQWVEGRCRESESGRHVRDRGAACRRDSETSNGPPAAQAALPAWSALNGPAWSVALQSGDLLEQRCDEISADMTREEARRWRSRKARCGGR